MTNNKEIGLRIESRRKQLGLTLDEIATQVGVARSTIQRYEKGSIDNVKLPVLDSIANVLKVNASWIACKSDQMDILEIEKSTTVSDDGLSGAEAKLIELFHLVPKNQRGLVVDMIEAALKSQGLL